MGNQQIYPKRLHRLSEAIGFLQNDHDSERFVTLNKKKERVSVSLAE